MGDVRFRHAYERIRVAGNPASVVTGMTTDDLIMALAASSPDRDPLLVNVMATELQNRARRSMAVAESIGECIVITDERDEVTFVNPFGERLLGRHAAQLVGLHASKVLRLVDGRGTPVPWGTHPAWLGVALDADDGRRVPVDALAAPIRSRGDIIGTVLALRDVTYQRSIEDDLRFHKRLLDAVGEAVLATRTDGTIVYWNQGAELLYGWPAEEVLGQNIVDVTPTEASREQGEAIMANLRHGKPWSGVFPVQRRDGSTFLARVTDSPVLDETGRLVALIGVSRPHEAGPDG